MNKLVLRSMSFIFILCSTTGWQSPPGRSHDPPNPSPVVISPADGSSLKTNVQTFEWSPGADEYWLRIGTRPGRSDVYARHFPGAVTQHRVTDLPLDGHTFYVELRSRIRHRILISASHYTAAVRKGLCIIVDFRNARLEDWKEPPDWNRPPGFHNTAEVRAVLNQMAAHWNWLGRGREKVQWDLIRVQLPRDLVAYPENYGYADFRYEVMQHAGIDPADYDVNADGIVDSVWMVISAQGHIGGDPGYDYLSGGAALVSGVKSFADAQTAYAIAYRRYGAFNHEFSHNVGLPDLYGPYSTVEQLSLMGNTVEDLPAADYSAFDREKLGWLKPRVIDHSTRGIFLPSANEKMAAVKIPTDQPFEYFLIEYRKTPESGYGSVGPRYNGLAVYHVFQPSFQVLNPPLLKIEAADGVVLPESGLSPDPTDLYYPGNPVMDTSLVMRSYFTERAIFRIRNVQWAGDGIRFDIQVLDKRGGTAPANVLANGSFEQGNGNPDDWTTIQDGISQVEWTSDVSHWGKHSVSISTDYPTFSQWLQPVTGMVPGGTYLLCGWLKGEDIVGYESKDVGANILLSGTFDRSNAGFGTFDWTRTCMAFQAPASGIATVACGLGGWGSTASGTVWCDDFGVYPLHPAF